MKRFREIVWRVGDWISAQPCIRGHHDYREWIPNVNPTRAIYDWYRECCRCHHEEKLYVGTNPPGKQHPSPRRF